MRGAGEYQAVAGSETAIFDVLGAASAVFRARMPQLVPVVHTAAVCAEKGDRRGRMAMTIKGGRCQGGGRYMCYVGKILTVS